MAETTEIRRVALVGGGVIGSGWAARCLAHGLDVVATDPGPGAEEKIRASVANAWPALTEVGLKPGASQERLSFAKSLEAAVAEADFIQESAPENDDLKRKLHARDRRRGQARRSSSRPAPPGLLPSNFQADCKHPERVLVGHPFNPVYLLPLVEVLGGKKTSPAAIDTAIAFYKRIGMRPLKVAGRGPRLYRRPPAGGALARGAASDRRRRLHHRRDRRCDPLRPRPALVLLRHLPDLSPGRRRRRHGAFHGPFRPGPGAALDQPQGPRS